MEVIMIVSDTIYMKTESIIPKQLTRYRVDVSHSTLGYMYPFWKEKKRLSTFDQYNFI